MNQAQLIVLIFCLLASVIGYVVVRKIIKEAKEIEERQDDKKKRTTNKEKIKNLLDFQ